MSNHITPEPVPATQSAACVYCRKTDVPLSETVHTKRMACDACTAIVDPAMETRVEQAADTPLPAPEKELPRGWEQAAKQAAVTAEKSVRGTYDATMLAYDHQRASGEPAFWLTSHPCPPWCADGSLHSSSDSPEDREHDSDVHSVSLDAMEPSVAFAEFRAPAVTVFLTQHFREVEPRVCLEKDNDPIGYATLDEAEQLAFALLDLVRKGRRQESPKLLPYDEHGQCVTRDCTVCRIQGASA